MANFTKILGASAIAAVLSTPALAQEAWDYGTWDADTDDMISIEEFREGFAARMDLAQWDADGDGMLNEDEFAGGVYSRYDADTTDALEENEYGMIDRDFADGGIWSPMGVGDVETVDSAGVDMVDEDVPMDQLAGLEGWDIDGDGVLLRNEFEDGFREWGTFGEFDMDADAVVTQDEFVDGIFARYDADQSGYIEEPELTDIGDDMGDEGFWDV